MDTISFEELSQHYKMRTTVFTHPSYVKYIKNTNDWSNDDFEWILEHNLISKPLLYRNDHNVEMNRRKEQQRQITYELFDMVEQRNVRLFNTVMQHREDQNVFPIDALDMV